MRPPNPPWYPFGLRPPPLPLQQNMQVLAQGHPHLRPSWTACSPPPATILLKITTCRDNQISVHTALKFLDMLWGMCVRGGYSTGSAAIKNKIGRSLLIYCL